MRATTVKIEGLSELDKALSELPKATQRAVLLRVLKQAGEPMRAAAEQKAPRDTGELAESIVLTARMKNKIGNAEFSATLRDGGTRAEAVSAMRDARRAAAGEGRLNFGQVFIGPKAGISKQHAIKAMVQEFGSVKQAPQAYMRPAFDTMKGNVIADIGAKLGAEIKKTAARIAARKAKKGK